MKSKSHRRSHPPQWANQLLERFCAKEVLEPLQGDLHELYRKRRGRLGRMRADLHFVKDVCSVFRPFAFRKKQFANIKFYTMLQHTILLSFRGFMRYKRSFFINLVSLSTGLTCAFMIYFWVNDELHIDKFLKNDARLYQVLQNIHHTSEVETSESTPAPLAQVLAEEIPEVEYSTTVIPTIFNTSKGTTNIEDTRIKTKAQYVSQDFFNVFSYDLIEGSHQQALKDKHSAIISEELAIALFGDAKNAINKIIEWKASDINATCFVSGVFRSLPLNATNQFDLLLSFKLFEEHRPWVNDWKNNVPRTYLLLKEGVSIDQVNQKISNFIKSKYTDSKGTLFLQNYSDRHLYGKYENGISVGGRIDYVRLFSLVAIFTLMIACINFMNLSTAKASRRIKEIGIKKASGARQWTLMLQFMGESLFASFFSLGLAIIAISMLLPFFNTLTGKKVSLNFDVQHMLVFLAITMVTGLLAGSYPAFYLSKINSITALKGKLATTFGAFWVRKGLVIFQFAISVILIISVLIVYKQIAFIQSKNLGYERDQVVYFDTEKPSDTFITELTSIPGVLNAGAFFHDATAGGDHGSISDIRWEGKAPDNKQGFVNLTVGYGLIETLGLEMISGQAFSRNIFSENQIIFNEAAISAMGLEDPVGQSVRVWDQDYEIVGVVKDFHFESLYEQVKPCFLLLVPTTYMYNVMVKIQSGVESQTVDKLEELFKKYNPGLPFDYKFLDEEYQLRYKSEQNIATISGYFATIAILISCLGLFGLTSFATERRVREIGIRKILGCSNIGVIYLLSNEFTKLIMISIIVALPLSYVLVTRWLDNFEYRIVPTWWLFGITGLMVLLVAWAVMGVQIFKAANANPTQSLRNE